MNKLFVLENFFQRKQPKSKAMAGFFIDNIDLIDSPHSLIKAWNVYTANHHRSIIENNFRKVLKHNYNNLAEIDSLLELRSLTLEHSTPRSIIEAQILYILDNNMDSIIEIDLVVIFDNATIGSSLRKKVGKLIAHQMTQAELAFDFIETQSIMNEYFDCPEVIDYICHQLMEDDPGLFFNDVTIYEIISFYNVFSKVIVRTGNSNLLDITLQKRLNIEASLLAEEFKLLELVFIWEETTPGSIIETILTETIMELVKKIDNIDKLREALLVSDKSSFSQPHSVKDLLVNRLTNLINDFELEEDNIVPDQFFKLVREYDLLPWDLQRAVYRKAKELLKQTKSPA